MVFTPKTADGSERLRFEDSEVRVVSGSLARRGLGVHATVEIGGRTYEVHGAECGAPGCECDARLVEVGLHPAAGETPEERARRIGVPLVPRRPPEHPDHAVLAVCGVCGIDLRRVMMRCCQEEDCPCGLGRPARLVELSGVGSERGGVRVRWTDTGGTWGS